MATRFYFSSTATPTQSPGFAAWTRTSEAIRRTMSTVKDGSALTNTNFWANAAAAAGDRCLAVQFVSPPMPAGVAFVTTDTCRGVIKCAESATNDNINNLPICVKIYDKDGTTLRATLKALGHYGPNTTEWPTAIATKIMASDSPLGVNYTTAAGDLLVLEVGGGATAGGSSVTGTQNIGSAAGSDYALTEGLTTNLNGWFELSRTFSFQFTSAGAATIGAITADAVGTFTPAAVTGAGDAAVGSITADAAGTFTSATVTATGSATLGGITAEAAGTFTAPTYTAAGSATVGSVTADAIGTYSAGTFTGAGAATLGGVTADATGQFSRNHPVGILTRSVTGLGKMRAGDFSGKEITPPFFEGTASATIGSITATAGGMFAAPHPVGNLTRSVTGLGKMRTGTFTGKFGSTTFTGSAAATVGAITADAVGTFAAPVVTGAGTATLGGITADAVGSFFITGYSGSGEATVGGATAAASGTFTTPGATGTGAATVGSITADAAGTFSVTTFTGSASTTIGGITAQASSSFASAETLLIDLAGYYRFENNLLDSSGNARNLAGTVTYAPGQLGQGLDDGLAVADPWTGFTGRPLSFSFWLKPESGFGANLHFNQITNQRFGLQLALDGRIFKIQGAGLAELVTLSIGVRQHIVYTVSAAGVALLYVDGALVNTDTANPPTTFAVFHVETETPTLIDQLALYGKVLNPDEISILAEGFDPTEVEETAPRVTIPATEKWRVVLPARDPSRIVLPAIVMDA